MKWNGRNIRPVGQGFNPIRKQDFQTFLLNKRRDEKFSNIWGASFIGDVQPQETSPVVSPSLTPSNTPTVSITASNTPTPTPSITASPTVTPTNTSSPTGTPIVSPSPSSTATSTPAPTSSPTPTPSNAQFCKRFTGVRTFTGNGSNYNYTACNNQGGAVRIPNTAFGSTVTVYSRSGAPTKSLGTGVMTWTDQGFSEPCSGSTFTTIFTTGSQNAGTSWTVTDCGGATYSQSLTGANQAFSGCYTSISCNSNCIEGTFYERTNYGSCTT